MPNKKRSGTKNSARKNSSSGRKYGEAAGKSVESAMRREKGHSEIRQRRERRHGEEPETGYCDRTFRSTQKGRKGSEEEQSGVERGQRSDCEVNP